VSARDGSPATLLHCQQYMCIEISRQIKKDSVIAIISCTRDDSKWEDPIKRRANVNSTLLISPLREPIWTH
jgi:hypothetical protein